MFPYKYNFAQYEEKNSKTTKLPSTFCIFRVQFRTKRNLWLQGFVYRGSLELIMATLGGSRGDRPANSNHQKSSLVSPEKVREILNDGVSSSEAGSDRWFSEFAVCERTNKFESSQFWLAT